MSTDMQMYCEVRNNGKWNLVTDKVFKNKWYNPTSNSILCKEEFTNIPYDDRCYNLFAILADVRNGTGFAGVKTGECFNPISEPKGYPADLSDELWAEMVPSFGAYGASWLTLRELVEYDWDQLHRDYGCVSEDVYKNSVMQGECPQIWCGSVSGQNTVLLSEEAMVDLIDGIYPRDNTKQYYTCCYFVPKRYREVINGFYEDVIPVLKTLVPEGGTYDDVRLVFDFD